MKYQVDTNPLTIPQWHFSMLMDDERNYAIESAIASLDLTGKLVFEIGSGIGLVAMLFAKHGAERVIACEMDLTLAVIARDAVEQNGFSDRVSVLAKPSWQVLHDGDLPRTPDIIFTETLDCGVVGEGFHRIAEDIRKIARPDTLILPQVVRQFGFLCEDPQSFSRNATFVQNALDLSGLNSYSSRTFFSTNPLTHSPKALSPFISLHDFSYIDAAINDPMRRRVIAMHSGTCHGMVSYFDAMFGHFAASTRSRNSHWAMAFHPLQSPQCIEKDSAYWVSLSPEGSLIVSDA